MFEFLLAMLIAFVIMTLVLCISVAVTQPFHGALVRIRAAYAPKAVGLEGTENRAAPHLTSMIPTLRRIHRLEGWYGLYKGAYPTLMFMALVSAASIIFVGGSATKGPKNSYHVPEGNSLQMTVFTIVLTLITLPMTIIINRSIITPYKLPINARSSLKILLTPYELSKPLQLYLTPGLLGATFAHSVAATLIARSVRSVLIGSPTEDGYDASLWRWIVYIVFQALAVVWLAPLEVLMTKLSVQPRTDGFEQVPGEEEALPEGVEYAGTDEDVIGLRPISEPYSGLLDCARKIVEEEGPESLFRGWAWTMAGNVLGVYS